MSDSDDDLQRMWFRVRYDMDLGKWRYWAGEREVEHREWQELQYRQDNPERKKS